MLLPKNYTKLFILSVYILIIPLVHEWDFSIYWSDFVSLRGSLHTPYKSAKLLCILITIEKTLLYTWRNPLKLNFRKPYKTQESSFFDLLLKVRYPFEFHKANRKKKLFFWIEECVALTSWKTYQAPYKVI